MDSRPVRVLALTFYYPPANNPRAIQVARLLRRVSFPTSIICSSFHDANDRRDDSAALNSQHERIAVPFARAALPRLATRTAGRFIKPFWDELPDDCRHWKSAVIPAIEARRSSWSEKQLVLVTFGSPMSDHLIGLELKRKYGWPWLAFFSDPWTDNPFKTFNSFTRNANLKFEREVMETADRLLFTSEETIDLVLSKYSESMREKAGVLPHSFEPEQYPKTEPQSKTTIRYLGDMYGPRTPRPLFAALAEIQREQPEVLKGVVFEFVGSMCDLDLASMGLNDLPAGLVRLTPTVSNLESLKLMTGADALMVIDAPAERSVFLPSKLVDYLGAAKPILGITPPGTAEKLISSLGGKTADPSNIEAVKRAILATIEMIRYRRDSGTFNSPFGEPSIRKRFEAESVAAEFETMVQELT
jgi:hypothetical protein